MQKLSADDKVSFTSAKVDHVFYFYFRDVVSTNTSNDSDKTIVDVSKKLFFRRGVV